MQGKIVLLTGAGSGIGRALSLELTRLGAHVLAMGRTIAKLKQLDNDAAGACGEDHITPVPCDLCDMSQIDRVAGSIQVWPGKLDVLIHCAGEICFGGIDSIDGNDADRLWKTHVTGPMRLTQKLVGLLRNSKGQIVFVNSNAAVNARPDFMAYSMTKAAAWSLADSLRETLASDGVRVTTYLLGRVDTPMQQLVLEHEHETLERKELMSPESVASSIASGLLLPRSAELTDVYLRQTRGTPKA